MQSTAVRQLDLPGGIDERSTLFRSIV